MEKKLESKNNLLKVLLIVFIVFTFVLGGFIIYDKLLKNDTDNLFSRENELIMNEKDIISLGKNKLEQASNLSYLNGIKKDSYTEIDGNPYFVDYGKKDIFENKFYSIYSKQLAITDVLNGDGSDSRIPFFKIKDDIIYVDYACRASGSGSIWDDFKLENVNSNNIKITYLIHKTYDEFEFVELMDGKNESQIKQEYDDYIKSIKRSTLELVKEENDWKIKKATLIDACGSWGYDIGK